MARVTFRPRRSAISRRGRIGQGLALVVLGWMALALLYAAIVWAIAVAFFTSPALDACDATSSAVLFRVGGVAILLGSPSCR